ncbi:TPA: hypothetical protein N3A50_004356 [Salmonella enterica subsp. salamae serovar 30:g,m,s:e,n,x]|nr:hypothetical protein [Salmonella enterica subsp. salamae serovar 30:g,m,s:e,n,x]
MTELKKLLPLDELNKLASELNIFNGEKSIRQIINIIRKNTALMTYGYTVDTPLWRARICNNKHDGFNNISDIIYPLEKYVVKAGRLNNINESIFYLSTGYHAALSEVHANVGDYIQLTGFKFKENKFLNCCSIGEVSKFFKWGDSRFENEIRNAVKETDPASIDSLIFADTFLASLLSDSSAVDNKYIYTRTLSQLIFKNNKINAISYPGVESKEQKNFAIKPTAADEIFDITRTTVIKITDKYLCGMYKFDIIKEAKAIDYKNRLILW